MAFISDRSLFRGFHRHKALLRAVHDYDVLGADGDPYGEQDFGNFALFDERSPTLPHEAMAWRSGVAAVGLMSGPRCCCVGDNPPPALSTILHPAPFAQSGVCGASDGARSEMMLGKILLAVSSGIVARGWLGSAHGAASWVAAVALDDDPFAEHRRCRSQGPIPSLSRIP